MPRSEIRAIVRDLFDLADRCRDADARALSLVLDVAIQSAADGRIDDLADLAAGFALAELPGLGRGVGRN